MNLHRLLKCRRSEKGSFFNFKEEVLKYDFEIERKYGNLQREKTSVH
jgi:hypothetical protein